MTQVSTPTHILKQVYNTFLQDGLMRVEQRAYRPTACHRAYNQEGGDRRMPEHHPGACGKQRDPG